MKTLFVTALLAVAIGACSSDTSSTLVTTSSVSSDGGTVSSQGGPCATSADCESPLSCGFAVAADAGAGGSSCAANGVCIATGPCSYLSACSCGSQALPLSDVCFINTQTVNYSTQPVSSYSLVPGGAPSCAAAPVTDAAAGGSTTGG